MRRAVEPSSSASTSASAENGYEPPLHVDAELQVSLVRNIETLRGELNALKLKTGLTSAPETVGRRRARYALDCFVVFLGTVLAACLAQCSASPGGNGNLCETQAASLGLLGTSSMWTSITFGAWALHAGSSSTTNADFRFCLRNAVFVMALTTTAVLSHAGTAEPDAPMWIALFGTVLGFVAAVPSCSECLDCFHRR